MKTALSARLRQFITGIGSAPPETRDEVSAGEAQSSRPPPVGFRLLSWAELRDLPGPTWLIKDILPDRALGQLFGATGGGKTFVALEMALSVATGEDFLGIYKTTPGRVVYVAAESARGLKKRIEAWLHHRRLDGDALELFRVLDRELPLGDRDNVADFVRAIREAFPGKDAALVVLDTQARCTEGMEENAAKDMGLAMAAAGHIGRETGATVTLVHHTGYEGSTLAAQPR